MQSEGYINKREDGRDAPILLVNVSSKDTTQRPYSR